MAFTDGCTLYCLLKEGWLFDGTCILLGLIQKTLVGVEEAIHILLVKSGYPLWGPTKPGCPPPKIGKIWVPPYIAALTNNFKPPLYAFYGPTRRGFWKLVFGEIWVPPWKNGDIWTPPQMNDKIWLPPKTLHPSNIFWMVPKGVCSLHFHFSITWSTGVTCWRVSYLLYILTCLWPRWLDDVNFTCEFGWVDPWVLVNYMMTDVKLVLQLGKPCLFHDLMIYVNLVVIIVQLWTKHCSLKKVKLCKYILWHKCGCKLENGFHQNNLTFINLMCCVSFWLVDVYGRQQQETFVIKMNTSL